MFHGEKTVPCRALVQAGGDEMELLALLLGLPAALAGLSLSAAARDDADSPDEDAPEAWLDDGGERWSGSPTEDLSEESLAIWRAEDWAEDWAASARWAEDDGLPADRASGAAAGTAGRDSIIGHDGNDYVWLGQGTDTYSDTAPADELLGSDDTVVGGGGNDFITDHHGANRLSGGAGRDYLDGTDADGAADHLTGGLGADVLIGDDGDILDGGRFGEGWGEGDHFVLRPTAGDEPVTIRGFNPAHDRISVQTDPASPPPALDLTADPDGGATLLWLDGTLLARIADVSLEDIRSGRIELVGPAPDFAETARLLGQNDSAAFGDGGAHVRGGTGGDTLTGGAGQDSLCGEYGADLLRGGAGHDSLDGGHGADSLFGGAGNDALAGGRGNDALHGDAGDDVLYGVDPHTVNSFHAGQDSLFGGAGNDRLVVSLGDVVAGGEGADVVEVWVQPGRDLQDDAAVVITDYQPGIDRVEVMVDNANSHGVNRMVLEQQGDDVLCRLTLAGSAESAVVAVLQGVSLDQVDPDDFHLTATRGGGGAILPG